MILKNDENFYLRRMTKKTNKENTHFDEMKKY